MKCIKQLQDRETICSQCGNQIKAFHMYFRYPGYPGGEDTEDFYGKDVCNQCVEDADENVLVLK